MRTTHNLGTPNFNTEQEIYEIYIYTKYIYIYRQDDTRHALLLTRWSLDRL